MLFDKLCVFYISSMWWELISDADSSVLEREHCSVDVATGGYVMATVFDGFNRPGGGGVMMIMLFNML